MIIELSKNIKLIRPEKKASFPYSNSLFIDDDIRLIIDAGAGGKAFSAIPLAEIDLLFLSHYHFDHTHGTRHFNRAKIMVGSQEEPAYTDPSAYAFYSGFSRWEELMGYPKKQSFAGGVNLPLDVVEKPGYRPIPLGGVFNDGDSFSLGSITVHTLHTPGHTHGHYAFWLDKEGILFACDIDLSPGGPWYGEELSDFDEVIKSVERIIQMDPEILVSSHRRAFKQPDDNIKQLLRNYLDVALKREENILECLSVPRSIAEIAQMGLVYEPPWTQYIDFWNRMMILKHLERLQRLNMVEKTDKAGYIRKYS